MAEIKKDAEVAKATKEVKKVIRRGVGNARGTTKLKFSHEQAAPNGLFIAHLDNVEIQTIKVGEEKTGLPSFTGLEIPKLVITFASNESDVNKRHYVTLQFNAVESNANTIPGGSEAWKVDSVFDWLKHILNVYVLKGREMTEEEQAALSLPFEDFDEQGEYVSIDAEEVIAGWKTLFENFENIINRGNDGKPYYKDKSGKDIIVWIKLLRYVKAGKNGWKAINNGELAFPAFVGEGCVELWKQNTIVSIRVNSVREAIIPMNVDKPKSPNMPMPGMGGGSMMPIGGIPVGDPMVMNQGFNNIANEAVEDMPF